MESGGRRGIFWEERGAELLLTERERAQREQKKRRTLKERVQPETRPGGVGVPGVSGEGSVVSGEGSVVW